MLEVYKDSTLVDNDRIICLNDIFFNKVTCHKLDEKAAKIISNIDKSTMLDKYSILSRFDNSKLNIDKLSTGCKTVLNIMYNPDRIFDIRSCGDNAIDLIYQLEEGKIYSNYPLITFNDFKVKVNNNGEETVIGDYEELKAWWSEENNNKRIF